MHSACSRTGQRHSSCPPIHCSSKRCRTLSASIYPPTGRSCCAWIKSRKYRHWDHEQPVLPMTPGVSERRTHTYIRNGNTSLFAAFDIATGAMIGKVLQAPPGDRVSRLPQADRRRDARWAERSPRDGQLRHSQDAWIKAWRAVRIGMSISHGHRRHGSIRSNAGSRNSPVSNFSAVSIGPPPILEADITAFITAHNENPKSYRWVKSAAEILASVKRFYQKQ